MVVVKGGVDTVLGPHLLIERGRTRCQTPSHTDMYTSPKYHLPIPVQRCLYKLEVYSICGQHPVSFFMNSSTQNRENEAKRDSNEK